MFIWVCVNDWQAAHQSGEHEVNLSIFGGNYTVDFETMQQINDDTGTARHVQRKVNPLAVTSTGEWNTKDFSLSPVCKTLLVEDLTLILVTKIGWLKCILDRVQWGLGLTVVVWFETGSLRFDTLVSNFAVKGKFGFRLWRKLASVYVLCCGNWVLDWLFGLRLKLVTSIYYFHI